MIEAQEKTLTDELLDLTVAESDEVLVEEQIETEEAKEEPIQEDTSEETQEGTQKETQDETIESETTSEKEAVVTKEMSEKYPYLKTFIGKPIDEVAKSYEMINREYTKLSQASKTILEKTTRNVKV